MNFYSIQNKSHRVNFETATLRGQAPDKGLYFPESLPVVPKELIADLKILSEAEIAFRVMAPYVGDSLPDEKLFEIVSDTVNFPIPLVPVTERISSLELYHGPTLAFKDVGARFMSRCLGYFLRNEERHVTVLVATSGDTGGAVANGFYDVPGVDVVILYPKGRVSPVQEKQLTTLGRNITALEINGSFDDCQQMVKQAFTDAEINRERFLTSANSINVARWLPQQIYYFLAYRQWREPQESPVVCVPSGNFGNICAGILAKITGLPLGHFIAACNINDVVSSYLQDQKWEPKEAVATLSNAMDVGNPSNFVRIIELFHHQFPALKNNLSAYTVTDKETVETIRKVFGTHQYLLDPHGAVAYLAMEKYLQANSGKKGFILETAHPVKFPEAVEKAISRKVPVPDGLAGLMKKEKRSLEMEPVFSDLKDFLIVGQRR
jgi:threonine synthase